MGAVTTTIPIDGHSVAGNKRVTRGSISLSSSYASGGDTYTLSQFGLMSLDLLDIVQTSGYTFEVDYTNKKVKAMWSGNGVPDVVVTGGQGAGTALQMTPDTNAGVLGKTAATTRTIPGATFGFTAKPGAQAEVTAATDLSAVAAKFTAIGA